MSGSPTATSQQPNSLQTPPTSTCHYSRSDNINEIQARLSSRTRRQSSLTNSPTTGKYLQSDALGQKRLETTLTEKENRDIPSPIKYSDLDMRVDGYRSPLNNQHDLASSRKRSSRDFSAEEDEGPKRQKDEGHQKDRRKAPKVAAAYR